MLNAYKGLRAATMSWNSHRQQTINRF